MTTRITRLLVLLALAAGLAAGCGPAVIDREPDTGTAPEPEPRETKTSPAVLELSARARDAMDHRRHDTAVQLLERAIRIEPRNGELWHLLARVRFEQGNYEQARQLAARSNALLAGGSVLKGRNDDLIEAARREQSY